MTLRRTVLLSTAAVIVLMGGTFALAASNSQPEFLAQAPTTTPAAPGVCDGTGPHGPRGGPRGGGMGMMGMGGMPWVDELNLSTEQTEQIRTIRDQARTDTTELRQQLWAAHQEMRTLMASDASADQLRSQHQEVQDLMQQLGDEHFDTMLEIRDVLTPEQRAQLAELQQQRRGNPMNFDLEESAPQ